jgi:predicted HTH domain antitoxin
MERRLINVEIPNDILCELTSIPTTKTIEDKLKLNLAIGLFASKSISLAKASQLADKPLYDFIIMLNAINIPVVDYTEDTFKDDIDFIKKYKNEGI